MPMTGLAHANKYIKASIVWRCKAIPEMGSVTKSTLSKFVTKQLLTAPVCRASQVELNVTACMMTNSSKAL